jgi:ankyrin repeat protein
VLGSVRSARAYKHEVLAEWRQREEERSASWKALVGRAQLDLVKVAARAYERVRHYVSGEFGLPSARDKSEFIFGAARGELKTVKHYVLAFGECSGALDAQLEADGRTALSVAAGSGETKVVELLIESGASPVVRDRFGCVPLHYAARCGDYEVLDFLIQAAEHWGQHVDVRNRLGLTPLMGAAEEGDTYAIQVLVDAGADPALRDRFERWTALHYAARTGDEPTVRMLLKAGVDFRVRSTTGQTAHHVALDHGHEAVALLLVAWRRFFVFPERAIKGASIDDMDLYSVAKALGRAERERAKSPERTQMSER